MINKSTLITLIDFESCLKNNKVGQFEIKAFGRPVTITFINVKWYQFLRKNRIKKTIKYIENHKIAGLEILCRINK